MVKEYMYTKLTTPIDFGRQIVTIMATRGPKLKNGLRAIFQQQCDQLTFPKSAQNLSESVKLRQTGARYSIMTFCRK